MSVIRWLALALGLAVTSCQSPTPTTSSPAGSISLRTKSPDGKHLTLTDGSSWTIQPIGQGATFHWAPGDPILVRRISHPIYFFALTNTRDGSAALGRFEQMGPAQPAPWLR